MAQTKMSIGTEPPFLAKILYVGGKSSLCKVRLYSEYDTKFAIKIVDEAFKKLVLLI